jgi:8-oxo-dGTP pyrophosphatase MutT (NUDIX family)
LSADKRARPGERREPERLTGGPEREVLHRGHIVELVRLDGRWEVAEHQPSVAVLVLEGRQVLGVRQVRPAIGRRTWELPAGLIDAGEEPEQAARRELAEEAGLGGRLELITSMYTSPGFTDELLYLYEATELEPAHAEADEGEELELAWLDVRTAWDGARNGTIATSAPTLVGLAVALARLGPR